MGGNIPCGAHRSAENALLTCKVKLFFLPVLNIHIKTRIVELSDSLQKDRIVERVPARRYGFENTESLWLEHSDYQKV